MVCTWYVMLAQASSLRKSLELQCTEEYFWNVWILVGNSYTKRVHRTPYKCSLRVSLFMLLLYFLSHRVFLRSFFSRLILSLSFFVLMPKKNKGKTWWFHFGFPEKLRNSEMNKCFIFCFVFVVVSEHGGARERQNISQDIFFLE